MTPAGGCHRFGGTNRLRLQGLPHPLPPAGQPTFRGVFPTFAPAMAPTLLHIQRLKDVLSSGAQRPVREANHSPPLNTDLKNSWRYASTPHTPMASTEKNFTFHRSRYKHAAVKVAYRNTELYFV